MTSGAEISYKKQTSLARVSNIIDADYRLGILRYQSAYEQNFRICSPKGA